MAAFADLTTDKIRDLYVSTRECVAMSHFYSLGVTYGRSMFANPPMGWSGCEPFAIGGYDSEQSFFTGVVWWNEETGHFSDVQPHA